MRRSQISLIALIFMLFCAEARSYTVTPIIQHFSPEGKESSQTFLIENSADHSIAVEFEVTSRTILEDGSEKREASKDFSVYPLQMTLEAKSKRNIRLSYLGEKKIDKELPYRLIVRQLPISEQKNKSGVNFMFEYIASIYVGLPQFTEGPLHGTVIGDLKKNKESLLKVSLTNQGTKHLLTDNLECRLLEGQKDYSVTSADWLTPPLPNYLPGGKSIVVVRLPTGIIGRQAKLSCLNKAKN